MLPPEKFRHLMPGRIKRKNANRASKIVSSPIKPDFFQILLPQLVGERRLSCYHPLCISRKIFKKVTKTIFPNENNGNSTSMLSNDDLFAAVNKI
jgi:hypothetical protein